MNVIIVTFELWKVFFPLHCKLYIPYLVFRQTRSCFSKKYIYFFIPHTEYVSLVQFHVFNLQCLEEATQRGTRLSHFQREIAFFLLKYFKKYAKIQMELPNYKVYFRMRSMSFLLLKCHIGNDTSCYPEPFYLKI